MKAQHQINFKRRRTGRPRQNEVAKVARQENSLDVTGAQVVVGERELKFARALSDTEKEVRNASLESLRTWLSENAESLCDSEIDRLWKALFYCVWMADKRPVITATIGAIVDLADIVGWKFLHGLLRCLVREWSGIDKHRVDKYYELVNAALRKGTERVVEAEADKDFTEEAEIFFAVLDETVWSRVPKAGLGVALHILDVYSDKIMRPLLSRGRKLRGNEVHKIFDALLENLFAKACFSERHSLSVGKRILDGVFGGLVEVVRDEAIGLKVKDQRDMIMRASKRIFAIAASKSTSTELRKGLYDVRMELKAFVALVDDSKTEAISKVKSKDRKKGSLDKRESIKNGEKDEQEVRGVDEE